MRKILMGAVAAAAVGMTLMTGGQAASAATSQIEDRQVVSPTVADTVQGWRYVDWFWTYGNCASNGGQMVARGEASDWRCDQSPYATFYLYVR